jgi:hypothetical protein
VGINSRKIIVLHIYVRSQDIIMFTVALFQMAERQEQPKCPLPQDGINKLLNIYRIAYNNENE